MLDLYFYSLESLYFLFAVGVIFLGLHSYYLGTLIINNSKKYVYIVFCEILFLLTLSLFSLIPVFVVANRTFGSVGVGHLENALYLIGIPCFLCFLVLCKQNKKHLDFYRLITLLFLLLAMPFMTIGVYGYFYLLIFSVLIISTVYLIRKEMRKESNKLTAFSIKQALDSLPSALMFADSSGYMYLTNRKMEQLSAIIFSKEYKNAKHFWNDISHKKLENIFRTSVGEDILLRIHNKTWRFSKYAFLINKQEYIEIIGVDVTEVVTLLDELEEDKQKLIEQREHIRILAKNMELLRTEQEFSRIRMQVHDVIGQRLASLQRVLHISSTDYESLVPLLQDMVLQIKRKEHESAEKFLEELKNYFNSIGVNIVFNGELPRNEQNAFVFLSLLREACTNAIRHARADKISAFSNICETFSTLTIINNGDIPKKEVVEGSGLKGMRKRIESLGGKMHIDTKERFTLTFTVDSV